MEYIDLEVWKVTRELVKEIYHTTASFPPSQQLVLKLQLQKTVISILSNIAEGCGRSTSADTLRFLHMARGSLYELETPLFVAMDLNFLEEDSFEDIRILITKCKKLLNGFINYFMKLKST